MIEPTDITATILREMRDEMRQGFKAMEQRFDKLEARVETLENGMHGVQIILVNAIGMFDQRITALEAKVS
jgi:hypothetical protein